MLNRFEKFSLLKKNYCKLLDIRNLVEKLYSKTELILQISINSGVYKVRIEIP